jgi:myo-inositol-1(or 4)-monophosphatase
MTETVAPGNLRPLLDNVSELVMAHLSDILARRDRVSWKDDGSPVTAADIYVEDLVRSCLAACLPELSFVGEESFDPSEVLGSGYVALLDPIDGTENFISGLKEWGVSLGIWHGGRHAASMLLMPELGEGLKTGDRITPRTSRIVGFSSSFCEEIGRQMGEVRESRITGCAAYNLYNVTRGAFARFCNPRGAYGWDLLPGLMLALEHGCEVLVDGNEFDGRFLKPGQRYRVDVRHRHDLHPRQGPIG